MGVIIVERKIICTNGVTEKTRFPVGANTKRLPGKHYGKSTVKKKTENDRQAAKRLGRVINCNFTRQDLFVTLRYSDKGLSSLGDEAFRSAKRNIQLFLRRLKRRNPDIKYVYVTSNTDGKTGESVRMHHHLVISGCSAEEIEKEWKRHGSTHIAPLRNQDDYTPLAVYFVKQGCSDPNAQKYSTSKNMIMPLISERIVEDCREIKVDPRDSVLERNSYDPAISLCQYVRYKHYPKKVQKPPDGVSEK